MSHRPQFDTIAIWNAHGEDEALRNTIRERIRTVLGLPAEAEIEYKKHFGAEVAAGPVTYKSGPSVKYVKKAPAQSYAPIHRSKPGDPKGSEGKESA